MKTYTYGNLTVKVSEGLIRLLPRYNNHNAEKLIDEHCDSLVNEQPVQQRQVARRVERQASIRTRRLLKALLGWIKKSQKRYDACFRMACLPIDKVGFNICLKAGLSMNAAVSVLTFVRNVKAHGGYVSVLDVEDLIQEVENEQR